MLWVGGGVCKWVFALLSAPCRFWGKGGGGVLLLACLFLLVEGRGMDGLKVMEGVFWN